MAPPPHPRPAANRGTLSARQLQDIRDMARIAREEEVTLIIHGVKIFGDQDKPTAGKPQQARPQKDRDNVHEQDEAHEPMDTVDPPASPTAAKSKKEERDARRATENRARKRVARWRSLVKRLIYDRVWMPLWKQMRLETSGPKRNARRRMRNALWAEWRRKQFDRGESSSALPSDSRRLSHRDRWLLRRSKPHPSPPSPDGYWQLQQAVWLSDAEDAGLSAEAAEEELLARALEESLADLTDMDAETRSDRSAATGSLSEPGEKHKIATPDSSRRRGKKTRASDRR